MGYTKYSVETRALRAETSGYYTKSTAETFVQTKERRVHDDMAPKGIKLRECRDSEIHPETFPVILALDLTGSMGAIPEALIRDGLPKIVSSLIQGGVKDVSLCFIGVGDHECDSFPLQIGQFESGDEEIDMWLTRTYLEKGGGGNAGESYQLAWSFAADHCVTDSFEKRGKKGVLITIGDEPCLKVTPKTALSSIFGEDNHSCQSSKVSSEELLEAAKSKWDVFHINIEHGHRKGPYNWKDLVGENLITTNKFESVPDLIVEIVLKCFSSQCNCQTLPAEGGGDGGEVLL